MTLYPRSLVDLAVVVVTPGYVLALAVARAYLGESA